MPTRRNNITYLHFIPKKKGLQHMANPQESLMQLHAQLSVATHQAILAAANAMQISVVPATSLLLLHALTSLNFTPAERTPTLELAIQKLTKAVDKYNTIRKDYA